MMKTAAKKESEGIKRFFAKGTVRWYDWLVLGLVLVFCFLTYVMSDLYHTAACSYGYLDGHFADFYDYLASSGISSDGSVGIHASYMPTVYLIFAVWNIPMKLFGIVPQATMQLGILPIMWAKLLPCLVLAGSAVIVVKILKSLNMSDQKASVTVFAYLSCPVMIYGQWIIGQYESFFVFLLLLGFYFWLTDRMPGFIISFGLAVTFKYTALLVFFPLLFLKEKNLWKILLYSALTCLPFALEYLLYMHSEAFTAYVFGIGSSGDTPTGYITNAAIFTGFTLGGNLEYKVYLTYMAFIFVCAGAYFKDVNTRTEAGQYGAYFAGLALAALFCFSKWHTHWLMPMFAFFTLTAFMHRRTGAFMALDLLFGILYIMFCTCQFAGAHDEAMLNNGIFKFLMQGKAVSQAYSLTEYLNKLDMSTELTLLTAIMGVAAVFKHPKLMAQDINLSVNKEMVWIRLRYLLPVLLLAVPSLIVVCKSIDPPTACYDEDRRAVFVNMSDAAEVVQPFNAEGETLEKLVFPVSRGEEYDQPVMRVSVTDGEGKILYEEKLNIGEYGEGQLVRLKTDITGLVPGETYYVVFDMEEADEDSTFCLLACDFDTEGVDNAVSEDGDPLGYHMCMRIYQ